MKKFKPLIATLMSIVIAFGALYAADFVLKDRTDHGVKQGLAMYKQPKDSIDVLMLGSSHVHYGVNTAKLWEDYGIASFNYTSAEQPLWISYYYLKEFCKYQKPKVVVLDFFSPAAFQEGFKFTYTHLAESMNGFRFSPLKLQMMAASFDWKKDVWNKYFPSFFGYHDRYDRLTEEDFEEISYDYTYYKGFAPHFDMQAVGAPQLNPSDIVPPSDKSVKYLQKIVDYTRENGIELYLTVVPYRVNEQQINDQVQEEDVRYNWLVDYVAKQNEQGNNGLYFDYTMAHYWDIGIDFDSGEDTQDASHLNYYGSCKFSDYLAGQLRGRYGEDMIPDHRGDERYSSWDQHVLDTKELVSENGFEWR